MGSIRATGAAKRVGQSCYTPDGSMIVNGDETGKVHVYDSKRGQLVSEYLHKIFGGWYHRREQPYSDPGESLYPVDFLKRDIFDSFIIFLREA